VEFAKVADSIRGRNIERPISERGLPIDREWVTNTWEENGN